jgi:hypothetical protein
LGAANIYRVAEQGKEACSWSEGSNMTVDGCKLARAADGSLREKLMLTMLAFLTKSA